MRSLLLNRHWSKQSASPQLRAPFISISFVRKLVTEAKCPWKMFETFILFPGNKLCFHTRNVARTCKRRNVGNVVSSFAGFFRNSTSSPRHMTSAYPHGNRPCYLATPLLKPQAQLFPLVSIKCSEIFSWLKRHFKDNNLNLSVACTRQSGS